MESPMDIKKQIIGEWSGRGSDNVPVLVSMDGNSKLVFAVGRDMVEGTWRIDDTKDPVQLDFYLHTEDHLTMRMIVQFLSDDELLFRIDNSNTRNRPSEFLPEDDGNNQLTLTRKKA